MFGKMPQDGQDDMSQDPGQGGDPKAAIIHAAEELIKALQESQLAGVKKTEVTTEAAPSDQGASPDDGMDLEKLKALLGK